MEGAFGTLVDHTRSVEAARGTLLAGIAEMEALAATVQAHEEKHHAELMRRRDDAAAEPIGRAPVCTPVTNAHLVCRLLLATNKKQTPPQYTMPAITITHPTSPTL